jgi:hypothetical protein
MARLSGGVSITPSYELKSGVEDLRQSRNLICVMVLTTLGACAQIADRAPAIVPAIVEDPNSLTIAFIGDQGSGAGARAVLQLIRSEGADLVLHQGDFDYKDDPAAWDRLITAVLGPDFSYFASVGNHDKKRFFGAGGYQDLLQQRLGRVPGAFCMDDLGVRSVCTYRNLFMVFSAIGTIPKRPDEPRHIAYLRGKLAASGALWKICSWHKNQRAMQLGNKKDAVGWAAYEACREAGAIIATGHEHSYSRAHLMRHFENKTILSTSPILRIGKGRTFAFVSGLGGKGIRRQRRDGPWWAAKYAKGQDATHGALFCSIADGGRASRAGCYFKAIDGTIVDRFLIVNEGRKPFRPTS